MSQLKIAIPLAVTVIVLALVARYFLGGHGVPAGQPPLADLTAGSLASFKGEFNRTSGLTRIILLLSPT